MTYAELYLEMEGEYIPYPTLLATREWLERRLEIIKRDNYCCTTCGKGETMAEHDEITDEVWYHWVDFLPERKFKEDDKWYIELERVEFELATKPYHMQVHHRRYIRNRLPWEYDDSDLITLCNWCHSEFHQHFLVDRYAEDGTTLVDDLEPCSRCQGTGNLPEYKHVMDGVCFKCDGERYKLPLVKII